MGKTKGKQGNMVLMPVPDFPHVVPPYRRSVSKNPTGYHYKKFMLLD